MPYSEDELRLKLEQAFDSSKADLPLFDKTVVTIMRELSKEEPDIGKLSRIILTDQSLTTQVLKVANSSFFRRLTKVKSIDDAVLRLGINWISNIVVLLTQQDRVGSKDPVLRDCMELLWRHSVACAIGTLWVVERKGLNAIKPEAFIAGLLHDEGKLIVLVLIDDMYKQGQIDTPIEEDTILRLMDELHPAFGYELMRTWNIPDQYSVVARDHHAEEYDRGNILLNVVRLVDRACNSLGIGLHGEQPVELAGLPENEILDLAYETLVDLEQSLLDSKALASNPKARAKVSPVEKKAEPQPSRIQPGPDLKQTDGQGAENKAGQEKPKENDEDITAAITIYIEVLKAVRKSLVAEIGQDAYEVFKQNKPAATARQERFFKNFDINNPPSTNISVLLNALEQDDDKAEALGFLVKSFNVYVAQVFKTTLERLDNNVINEFISDLERELPYYNNFITKELKKIKILESLQALMAGMRQAVERKKS